MNNCNFIGRVVTDLELQYGTNDVVYLRFRLAVRRQRTKEDKTDFISCKAFNKTAEFIVKYFKKGDPIWVETSYREDQYTDGDGNTRYAHYFIVNNVGFCPSNSKHNSAADTEDLNKTSGPNNGTSGTLFEFPF